MTAQTETPPEPSVALQHGFPHGYFVVKSVGTGRLMDVERNEGAGAEIVLWPEKERSLVEGFRDAGADNQVFFIDPETGALCSRASGHAIDVDGDRLVVRPRRPLGPYPYPNKLSHPFPKFQYTPEGEILVHFACDPAYPRPGQPRSEAWKSKTYVLASIPERKPRTVLDDTSEFFATNILGPIGGVFGAAFKPQATPDAVVKSGLELGTDEVVEEERREEDEVDDSPELLRRIRVLAIAEKEHEDMKLTEGARDRRRWIVTPLRQGNARTGV